MKVKRQHLVKGQIDYEHLSPNTIKFDVPVLMLAESYTAPIDSTGVKYTCGYIEVTEEMLRHLKEAYFEAYATSPSATDAVVDVELYNITDGGLVMKVTFNGEGGFKKSDDIASTLKTLAGKILSVRINVTTASGTSGATQTFKSAILRLRYGIS